MPSTMARSDTIATSISRGMVEATQRISFLKEASLDDPKVPLDGSFRKQPGATA